MGFLDKVKGAAATAKAELDKSGLVDQVKDKARETWQAGTPAERPEAPPDDRDLRLMVDAIRRGAIDPRTLVDRTEVAAVIGAEVGEPRVGFDDGTVHAWFETADRKRFRRATLSVCHAMDDEYPWVPQEHWDWVVDTYGEDGIVRIPGLGDEAFRQDAYVWVRTPERVLYAEVVADGVDEAARGAWAEQLLRLALSRLP